MGRPSPEPGPAVAAWAVCACRVADRRRSIPDRRRPEPPADKQRQHQRQRAKQTRPPTHAQGRQQTASTASQAEARHRPASAASTSRAPAKQTRPPAKIPNARDFSSPPLIAIHPLLYPPPARRRVLPAQTRTFAGSRAQKLIRCDAFFSFPAGPGEKMEGGQKIWNAHAGGGARGKRNAGVRSGRVSFSRRHENGGRSWRGGSCWGARMDHARAGALRRGGDLVRGGAFCSGGLGFWYAWKNIFGVSNFRRFSVLH
jgi:hypothetical protein